MKVEAPDAVLDTIDRSGGWVIGTFTLGSLFKWIEMLSFEARVPPLTATEAFVQIATSLITVIPSTIGGIGIIMLYRWRHEARLLKEANDHIVNLRRIANEEKYGIGMNSDPILKAVKNPSSDEPTVDLL
jgi:hypothetical protein